MIRAALALAAKGISVFPCTPGQKIPACSHGFKDATTDFIAINIWWQACPDFNIGIATGAVSGVFVLDPDAAEAEATLEAWQREHGELPNTIEAVTAKGRHLYFKQPAGISIASSQGKLDPHLDVRADGGYVLSPPFRHPDGPRYRWKNTGTKNFAEPPQWLLDKLAALTRPNGKCALPPSMWRGLVANGIDEGSRNSAVTALVGHLLRRFVDPHVVLSLMQAWNTASCRPPLPSEDIARIVNSVCGIELRRRGGG